MSRLSQACQISQFLYLYISFISIFACFSEFPLIVRIKKIQIESSITRYWLLIKFFLHLIGNSDGEIISKMCRKMHPKIHRCRMKKFVQTKIATERPQAEIKGSFLVSLSKK